MKVRVLGRSIGLGCASVLLLVTAARADCVKRHPLLGVEISVADAECPKAAKTPAAGRTTSRPAAAGKAATAEPGDPELRQLQQLLARAGYQPGPATGVMNDRTKGAAYAFKQTYGLKAGTDAEETIEALREVLAGKRQPPAAKAATAAPAKSVATAVAAVAPSGAAEAQKGDPEIAALQTLLAAVGYNPGPVTGKNNPATRDAAHAFKRAMNMKVGTDTEETLEVLRRIRGL